MYARRSDSYDMQLRLLLNDGTDCYYASVGHVNSDFRGLTVIYKDDNGLPAFALYSIDRITRMFIRHQAPAA